MTEIGRHDDIYRSTPLEQKLAWFQNAPGLSAVEPARDFMVGAAALYTDSDSTVRATLRGLGANWTGDAATNAGATLQRAANWSHDAGASHGIGGETVGGYGKSFEFVRGQVHWDDPWAWGWNDTASAAASVATLNPAPFLGNLTSDYFTTAQQNRTNDVAAVAALRSHEEQTRNAVDTFPSIVQQPARGREGIGPNPGGRDTVDDPPAPPVSPAGGPAGGGAVGGGPAGATGAGGPAGAGIPGGPGGSAPGAGVPGIVPGVVPTGPAGAGGSPAERQARAAQEARQRARIPAARRRRGTRRWPGAGGAVPGGVPGAGGVVGGRGGGGPGLDGRTGGAIPGSDPRLRGGGEPPGGPLRLPPGEGAGRLGGGLASGAPLSGEGADGSAVAPHHSPAKGPDASASGAVSRADGGT